MSNNFITETLHTVTSECDYKLRIAHRIQDDEIWLYIENEAFRMEYEEAKQLAELLTKMASA